MTHYGTFDHTIPDPKPIRGWYDTDVLEYPTLPDAADLIELTQAQWTHHTEGSWAVSGGALVPYTPPPPTLTVGQQATALMGSPVVVQCTTVPALDATYENTSLTRQTMTGIVAQMNADMTLPGGGTTFNWPDVDGTMRMWPPSEFVAFTNALTQFVYACQQTIGGFSTVLPSNVLVVDPAAVIATRRLLYPNWPDPWPARAGGSAGGEPDAPDSRVEPTPGRGL
jgi:hypothetical protein